MFIHGLVVGLSLYHLLWVVIKRRIANYSIALLWWQLVLHVCISSVDVSLLPRPHGVHTDVCTLVNTSKRGDDMFALYYGGSAAMWLAIGYRDGYAKRRTINKDDAVMGLHHIVTSALIAVSYCIDQQAIGNVILALHNISDIFITLLKLMAKHEARQSYLRVVYVVTLLVWTYTRLHVFRRMAFESVVIANGSAQVACACFLVTLLAMHVYWTALLIKIAISSGGQAQHMVQAYQKNDKQKIK